MAWATCAVQQTELGVGQGRGLLDHADGADEGAWQRAAADRKVLHGALRLRAPERIGRHLQLAHAVAFGTERSCHQKHSGTVSFANPNIPYCPLPDCARMSATEPSALTALSPLDGRYRRATEPLRELLSESGLIRERIRIEAQWLLHLAQAAPMLAGAELVRARCAPRRGRWPNIRRRMRPGLVKAHRGAHQSRCEGRRVLRARSAAGRRRHRGQSGAGAFRLHLGGHQQPKLREAAGRRAHRDARRGR